MGIPLLLLVASFIQMDCLVQESRVIKLAQGSVRGYQAPDAQVFEYFGIPYATVPKGRYRFTASLPGPTWNDTFEAVDQFIACPQNPLLYPNVPTREDCLVANVITPITGTNHSVLVYIHGGAYQLGFGHAMSPKALVGSQKLVAVTFNYRLGAHGFLCLGTEGAPGNAGLKDQVALLRWVQQNIAYFGGNPDDVTIAGYSAGSSSVGLLTLSRMAAGLFSKAIPESGADVGTWSVQIDPISNAIEYALQLGFKDVEDIHALEEFYQTADIDMLMSDAFEAKKDSTFHFTACVERDVGLEIFLHDNPVNIIKQGKYKKVPMLYGFTDMEGLFRMPEFYNWILDMNLRFSNYLPADLTFKNSIIREKVAKEIKSFYSVNNSSILNIKGYINYFTDVMFAFPVLRSIKLRLKSESENIFLYEYSFTKKYSNLILPGASHCSQTEAVLEDTVNEVSDKYYTEEYKQMRIELRRLWINFATTGTPVPESSALAWPPTTADESLYMSLGNVIILNRSMLKRDRIQFWDRIYDKYYRQPFPPALS